MDTVQILVSVTLGRALLRSHGVADVELDGPELSPEAVHRLRPLLRSHSFDLARPISIKPLPLSAPRGFRLTQVLVYRCRQ